MKRYLAECNCFLSYNYYNQPIFFYPKVVCSRHLQLLLLLWYPAREDVSTQHPTACMKPARLQLNVSFHHQNKRKVWRG